MTHVASPSRRFPPFRLAGWGALAVLLSIPALFRFPWTLSDFVIMGLLLGSVGLAIEYFVRQTGSTFVRLGAVTAVLAAFLTIWVNLAVGMIGEDEAYNLLFLVPMSAALLAGVATRLRPDAMVKASLLAAVLQAAIGLGGYGMDPRGAVLSAAFALLWLVPAALFRAGSSR